MKTNKKQKGTNLLLGASFCTLVIGLASLTNTGLTFKTIMAQYTAQGYPAADVIRQLVPSQLLPGIFQSVGIYLAMAAALYGLAVMNEKIKAVEPQVVAVEPTAVEAEEVTAEEVEATEAVADVETAEETEKTGA